nr:reverse transcriptase domain-containing protein [Tanacetum cinerariifolium]
MEKLSSFHKLMRTTLKLRRICCKLVQANPYHGFERENAHTQINNFKRITSTLKFRDVPNDVIKLMMFPYSLEGSARVWDVPNDVIKLMMFPYSLEGSARVWYDKEPPNSILTWDDLIRGDIGEAWELFKEMLRACPYHGFTDLTQIDTFYNGLNENDQDSLNAATGGNLLSKTTREALHIIKNKSKVRYSRNKLNVSRMNTISRENASKTDDRIDKLADQISTLVDIVPKKVVTPATVKAVEESCVACGGNRANYNCDATDSNQSSVCAAMGTYNQVSPQNHASNHMAPPDFAPMQIVKIGSLPSNTIPNSKGELKAITTQSGVAYEGPSIPTNLKKVVERETEETTDKEQTEMKASTAHIQPLLREKATNQMEKFFQIFQDLHFDISFTDALLLMPKFTSTIKSLLANKDKFFKLAKIPLNENCSAMLLKNLPKKLGDPGKFLIPWRFFLRTGRALIDVYKEEITILVNDEAVTFNLSQTTRYSCTYDDMSVNRTDVIDVAREEYAEEMLEEIEAYLKDKSISSEINHADCDPEGDICLIKKLLNDDPFQLPPMDLKQREVAKAKSSIGEPHELELKDLPSHLEHAYLEGVDKLPVIIAKDLKDDEKEAILK